jgi:hypothetical protein
MLNKVRLLNLIVLRFALITLLTLQVGYGFSQDIQFDGVTEGMSLKRDKEYQMYWKGSLTAQIVSVQFRKNDLVIHEGPGFLKAGKYQVQIPANLKCDNYTLRVVDPSTQAVLKSDQVKIKRRIPLVAHVAVVVIGFVSLLVLVPA